MTERLSNNALSLLAADISNSATTLTVVSASAFPSSGNFRIVVDLEIMLVTAISSNTFTVSRGQESTTIVAHSAGATVTHILTSSAISQYTSERTLTGTVANLPAAGVSGRVYYPTNGHYIYYDNGTSWMPYGPTWLVTAPVDSNYSWVNQGSATVSTTNGGVFLDCPSNGGADNLRIRAASIPGTTYTVTMGVKCFITINCGIYLLMRESSSGKMTGIAFGGTGGGGGGIIRFRTQNYTSPSSASTRSDFNMGFQNPIWFRLQDNGTNILYSIGCSPYDFIQIDSQTRTTPFTSSADQYAFAINPFDTEVAMQVFHLSVTQP